MKAACLAMLLVISIGCCVSVATSVDVGLSKIVIADVKSIDHLNLYVADQMRLFRKHGVDVSIIEARSQSAARDFVLSGQADIFWSCPTVAVSAIAEGAPLSIIAQVKTPCSSRLFLPKGSRISTIKGLAGKRVAGLSPNCEGVLAFQIQARENGGEFAVETSSGSRALAELAAGTIDGAVLEEPFASIAESKGFKSLPKSAHSYMPCQTINARKAILRENPEAVRRFIAAITEANGIIQQNPHNPRLVEIAGNSTALAGSVVVSALKNFHFTEQIDEQGLLGLAKELAARKAIRENPGERLFAQELKAFTWGKPK
jgi:NitT/TauT family transport system substrate-binding protein